MTTSFTQGNYHLKILFECVCIFWFHRDVTFYYQTDSAATFYFTVQFDVAGLSITMMNSLGERYGFIKLQTILPIFHWLKNTTH